jgi:hypothetical protein
MLKQRNDVQVLHLEADDEYYYLRKQLQLVTDRRFRDRSEPTLTSATSGSTGFFYSVTTPKSGSSRTPEAWKSSWQQTQQYLTGTVDPAADVAAQVDFFRNGVELSSLKSWAAGYAKISAGTPGHIVRGPEALGLEHDNDLSGRPWHDDFGFLDPRDFFFVSDAYKTRTRMTYPYPPTISEETSIYRGGILNGTIEVMAVRYTDSFGISSSTSGRFEPRGVKGSLGNGNQANPWGGTDETVSIYEFDTRRNNHVFDDSSTYMRPHSSYVKSEVYRSGRTPILVRTRTLRPFDDRVFSRDDDPGSKYDASLKSIVDRMSMLDTTYVREKEKSCTNGFVYDDAGSIGTDSIVYGGYLY